jgi:hypothetical protein
MAIGDTPLVMSHTRGALCGGKCGDRGRGGFDDDGAALVMLERRQTYASRSPIRYMYPRWWLLPHACVLMKLWGGMRICR